MVLTWLGGGCVRSLDIASAVVLWPGAEGAAPGINTAGKEVTFRKEVVPGKEAWFCEAYKMHYKSSVKFYFYHVHLLLV